LENGYLVEENSISVDSVNTQKIISSRFISDQDGDEFEISEATSGKDREWNTTDDVISRYQTTTEDNGNKIHCSFNQKGKDDLWFTADDTPSFCSVDTFDTQGRNNRTTFYQDFGDDKIFQLTDQSSGYRVYTYDDVGNLIHRTTNSNINSDEDSSFFIYNDTGVLEYVKHVRTQEPAVRAIEFHFYTAINNEPMVEKSISIDRNRIELHLYTYNKHNNEMISDETYFYYRILELTSFDLNLDLNVFNDTMFADLIPNEIDILAEQGFDIEKVAPERLSKYSRGVEKNNKYEWRKEIIKYSTGETTVITDIIIDRVPN